MILPTVDETGFIGNHLKSHRHKRSIPISIARELERIAAAAATMVRRTPAWDDVAAFCVADPSALGALTVDRVLCIWLST